MYIKSWKPTFGSVTVVKTELGLSLQVDQSVPLDPDCWDQALTYAWRSGYDLVSDQPSSIAGAVEWWDLGPTGDDAA